MSDEKEKERRAGESIVEKERINLLVGIHVFHTYAYSLSARSPGNCGSIIPDW